MLLSRWRQHGVLPELLFSPSHGCSKTRNVVFDPKRCFICKNKSRGDFLIGTNASSMKAPMLQWGSRPCTPGTVSAHGGSEGTSLFSGGDPPALLSPTFSHLLTDPSTVKCLGSKDGGATCPKVGRGAENFPAALLGKTLSREKGSCKGTGKHQLW